MRHLALMLLPTSGRCTEPGCPAPVRILDRLLASAGEPAGPDKARCARGHWSRVPSGAGVSGPGGTSAGGAERGGTGAEAEPSGTGRARPVAVDATRAAGATP
jgi:hypothetical protein